MVYKIKSIDIIEAFEMCAQQLIRICLVGYQTNSFLAKVLIIIRALLT